MYKLKQFEGPLDLLLHLIDQAEINIQDISISDITDQYTEYLHNMQQLELEITSEFLVMAATLLSMKSQQLLPRPPVIEWDDGCQDDVDDKPDPRAELIRKLIEYRKYKGIAEHLRERETERSMIFSKEPEDLTPFMPTAPENPVDGLHVVDLMAAFRKALSRASRRTQVATIHRDQISVKDRMKSMIDVIRPFGKGGKMMFSSLLGEHLTRSEIVVSFLALLELMKMKQIRCYQDRLFEDIVIQWIEEVDAGGLSDAEVDY